MSSARPRALSLESIYEARGSDDADTTQATAGHLSVVKDNRRKHLSENGTTSLVYGVLAALRQNSGLESPRIMDGTDLPMASTFPLRTAMMTASVKNITTETIEPVELQPLQPQQPQQSQQQEQVQEDQTIMHTADATNTNTAASIDTVTTATNNVEEGLKTSQEALDDTLATNKVTPLAPSLPVERRAPNSRSSSMNSTTSADHHDKKEGKAAFLLHRISVLRKNSFGENLKDADSSKSHSNHLSLHSKASKRSSKLLGKLVPKFLHTSPSALSSTSTSGSPGSQTGFSPFSHSNHSGSVTDQSSVHDEIMTPDSASFVMIPSPVSETHESLPFEPVVQTVQAVQEPEEVTSPTFATVVAPAFLECLRTDTKSPSLSLSSCFSGVSKTSDNSYASKPSGSSVISVYSAEEETKELTAITTGFKSQGMSGHTNAQNNEEEKGEEKEGAEGNDKATEIIHSALDDTLMSPYVIDENCDDVFFLNSVLRKKTPPTSTSSVTDSSLLSSSYTSSWTVNSNSMSSRASTPSVSGCSSASSQASTPSPTTPPQLDDQVYPFPPGHSLKSTMHMHYRSSPLPTNIQDGLDEKRTRLRDAVSEWRRSANASS
ncbi:hypothetical protein BGX34_011978 [Mortierella sp. NVP85]|nr:hypothetical protein BGX34_011978 [Mortierella sp. NVP85]